MVDNINSLKYDKLIICGCIRDLSIKILIDTGSNVSTIFRDVVDNINYSHFIDINEDGIINDIQGENKILGMLWCVELLFNGVDNKKDNRYFVNCYVLNKRTTNKFDVILGVDFLQQHKTVIDFCDNKIKIGKNYFEFKENLFN